MELFIDILILLAIIVGSVIVHRFLPAVPLPLLQVVLGCLAALSPFGIHVPLNPELFLVLFVAPLLYHDGRKTPRDELWKLKAPILLLALGLVFATVFIAGYGIHGLIPSIPLPAAFALAAILSPTDAVAVGAISRRVHLPKSILRLLEGEALINDASGMVAFKFAIAAMLTGVFSLSAASLSFVWMAIGGTVCGAALSFLIIRLRVLIRRLGVEEATLQTLLQIVTPFFIYLTAEELHVSGILAVVAGGIVHAIEQERAESSMLKLQIVSASTWSVILLMLNGLVFIMLGLHIPVVTAVTVESGAFDISRVLLYVAVLSSGLFALRFLWIYAGWTGAWLLGSRNKITKPQLKPALLTALSGVRGAITLAAAFSIPYTLQDGSPFPQRDLIIFMAAGVIVFTMVTASFVLPVLMKTEDDAAEAEQEEIGQAGGIRILQATIRLIREELSVCSEAAALSVISEERERKALRESEIRLIGIQAEREEAGSLFQNERISRETAYKFEELLNQLELLLTPGTPFPSAPSVRDMGSFISGLFVIEGRSIARFIRHAESVRCAKIDMYKAAIAAMKERIRNDNREISLSVIAEYSRRVQLLSPDASGQAGQEAFSLYQPKHWLEAVRALREEIRDLVDSGKLTRELAGRLLRCLDQVTRSVGEHNDPSFRRQGEGRL
ncbi:Na+/H+ antiporter [Paenibacillus validus]|uniref:Na+/H+ antiporter n=1 Tax=Paenibacillus validus TaxID=44253 RepID=A0A7X3CQ97_9BACL|nr:Na+/H+ antiporter [Paenibacillus validus]MUG69415.1 Na+/H+ antiporter [Paenibacillus validus]